MTIYKYLKKYYGIMIDNNKKISHHDIKISFPFLKRCSLDYANENKNLVSLGKIIMVSDSYNEELPYIPESFDKDYDEFTSIEINKKNNNEFKNTIINENTVININTYELGCLLSYYKYNRIYYRIIKNELISRGVYQNKLYKINKENKMIEESEYNDKYKRRQRIKY